MERRMLLAALGRRRGAVALATLAVAIGGSVCSALLHVSGDVSRKVTAELRMLGPNVIVRRAEDRSGDPWIDAAEALRRLAPLHLDAVPVLYAAAHVGDETIPVAGADLERARHLHAAWPAAAGAPSLMGARLARRLGVHAGDRVRFRIGAVEDSLAVAVLDVGGVDAETWWMPLATVQRDAGLPGRASLVQARIGSATAARPLTSALAGSGLRADVLHALSDTEAGLLARMRRLMALVTAAALAAAGLCAFGTLTDLALERRREIALMKALGATEAVVARQFALESLAIGLVGGVLGWLIGLAFAELIGREVFHAVITVRADVPLLVIAISVGVAGLAGLGPLRLARGIQPATVLKGD
jgi:putative ABC transport system permease protein